MRRSRKKKSPPQPSPEDTQEMFAAGGELDPPELDQPDEPETREEEFDEPETREQEFIEPETREEEFIEDETLEEEFDEPETLDEFDDTEVLEDEFDPTDEDIEPPEEDETEDASEADTAADGDTRRDRIEDLKVWFGGFRTRALTVGRSGLKRVGEIRLPRHEIDGQKVLAVAGIVSVALLVGAGGYVIGKGSGEDLDTARLEGEFAGKRAGAVAGATRGYAAGFKKGRDLAFRKSYEASYRRNYRRAYEEAGMDPPRAKDIEVPKP